MVKQRTIVWFRKDLRLHDNRAFIAAARRGEVVPVFIFAPEEEDVPVGAASKWWLHHSLQALSEQLASHGIPLLLRKGTSKEILTDLLAETNADAVYFNTRYEPAIRRRDSNLIDYLKAKEIDVQTYTSELLFEPGSITNKQGEIYKIFTPFWKQARTQYVAASQAIPPTLTSGVPDQVSVGKLQDLTLLPNYLWYKKLNAYWRPGEQHALEKWQDFLNTTIMYYDDERDYPAKDGVSGLSPYLAWGEISPRMMWHDISELLAYQDINQEQEAYGQVEAFLRQIVWRDFAYHQLVSFPQVINQPLKPEFKAFQWLEDEQALTRWQKGLTGYPVVDAGMRELWETGWMHNRIRMVTASFLIKHLLIHWKEGAAWFRDTLVDHDVANNIMGWQWVAGSGYDASPFFRIFNPVTQGDKFDAAGDYVRKWVPELASLPTKYLFAPWTAPKEVLAEAGIVLGETYPNKIVDHKAARERALATYHEMKEVK
ncbi:cryptochrome/photolyase family protein [Paraliobacillus ryukyuensis]|uniref:cryptochrome/photolyase family protein n=1 Tax=Paraliobacillus ryukyuensis TaxID=200904 RepID=UPI001B8627AE|nr:deoxyribodipyrimidine photo-lyase [Paraliobacillus ryukyuensis]